jgi:hypothetical protein
VSTSLTGKGSWKALWRQAMPPPTKFRSEYSPFR